MSGGDQPLETSYGRVILKKFLQKWLRCNLVTRLFCRVSYEDKHISKMVTCLLNQRLKCVDYYF